MVSSRVPTDDEVKERFFVTQSLLITCKIDGCNFSVQRNGPKQAYVAGRMHLEESHPELVLDDGALIAPRDYAKEAHERLGIAYRPNEARRFA